MNRVSWWRMSLGPASVAVSTPLPLDAGATGLQSHGDPPMYDLTPLAGGAPSGRDPATVIHEAVLGSPGATWDGARSSLVVRAGDGEMSAEELLYLAYLVLENQLQRSGFVTLHAAGACWQDRASCCWGRRVRVRPPRCYGCAGTTGPR